MNVTNDGVDIYDGLSGYFDDVVDFEDRKARMEVTLVDLPPVLQIQLQVRFYTSRILLATSDFVCFIASTIQSRNPSAI